MTLKSKLLFFFFTLISSSTWAVSSTNLGEVSALLQNKTLIVMRECSVKVVFDPATNKLNAHITRLQPKKDQPATLEVELIGTEDILQTPLNDVTPDHTFNGVEYSQVKNQKIQSMQVGIFQMPQDGKTKTVVNFLVIKTGEVKGQSVLHEQVISCALPTVSHSTLKDRLHLQGH